MNSAKLYSSFLILIVLVLPSSCGQNSDKSGKSQSTKESLGENMDTDKNYKVTFIELGSVKCIPCQKMQPVMEAIEEKYGKEVKVAFHDVWTEAGKPFGVKYGIEAIPTQIFLDETGKEYYRHVGYFPEEELVKVLQQKGIKMN